MKKLSILCASYKQPYWVAIMAAAFKKFPFSLESELIVVDNSPGHPSIKALTETSLGEGVKIINGNPDFPSHGNGYDLAYNQSDGDWIMGVETDAFPFRHGWGEEYIKVSPHFDLIGPLVPQSSGSYIHPAGAFYRRELIESVKEWQRDHSRWVFVPGAGAMLKTSPKACHVVAHEDWLAEFLISQDTRKQIDLWKSAGPFQEMRCFDEDTFENYGQRTAITNLEPAEGKPYYNKIGFEAGQFIHYFAKKNCFRVLSCPNEIIWMQGHEGRQAAESRIFGGLTHVWGGTVTSVSAQHMAPDVVQAKHKSMMKYFDLMVPEQDKNKILEIAEECKNHG